MSSSGGPFLVTGWFWMNDGFLGEARQMRQGDGMQDGIRGGESPQAKRAAQSRTLARFDGDGNGNGWDSGTIARKQPGDGNQCAHS